MQRSWVLLLILVVVLSPLYAQEGKGPKPTGVLSSLKVGQPISLKENTDSYQLTIIEGDLHIPQSHKIVEVGADWIVIEDVTGLNEVRIPLTSFKAVVHFKGLGKR